MNRYFFKSSHPFVLSSYYVLMLLIVMSTTNPIVISICFLASVSLRLLQMANNKKSGLLYPMVLVLLLTLTNPFFVHRGGTILFFFLNKPITQEALIYGFFSGLMIASVIYLFQAFQASVDSEQFFYLFGKRFPKLTLILTMIFRFIPLFQQYYRELNQVQKTLQRTQQRSLKEKAAYGLDLFGNLFSWALENAMDTADSMKARGYGVAKRSSRISYPWRIQDTAALLLLIGCSGVFFRALTKGYYQYNFYPYTESFTLLWQNHGWNYVLIIIVAFIPIVKRIKEGIIWAILKSRI